MTKTEDALDRNKRAFDNARLALVEKHRNEFALFHDEKFVAAYDTFLTAYDAGVDLFGDAPFFVARIVEVVERESFPALEFGLIRAFL